MAKSTDEEGRILDRESYTVPTRDGEAVPGGHRDTEKHRLNITYKPEPAVDWNPYR